MQPLTELNEVNKKKLPINLKIESKFFNIFKGDQFKITRGIRRERSIKIMKRKRIDDKFKTKCFDSNIIPDNSNLNIPSVKKLIVYLNKNKI